MLPINRINLTLLARGNGCKNSKNTQQIKIINDSQFPFTYLKGYKLD